MGQGVNMGRTVTIASTHLRLCSKEDFKASNISTAKPVTTRWRLSHTWTPFRTCSQTVCFSFFPWTQTMEQFDCEVKLFRGRCTRFQTILQKRFSRSSKRKKTTGSFTSKSDTFERPVRLLQIFRLKKNHFFSLIQ